jgi:hypothetical protein
MNRPAMAAAAAGGALALAAGGGYLAGHALGVHPARVTRQHTFVYYNVQHWATRTDYVPAAAVPGPAVTRVVTQTVTQDVPGPAPAAVPAVTVTVTVTATPTAVATP